MKKINLLLICLFTAITVSSSNLIKGTVITLADGTEISIEEVRENDTLLTLDAKNNSILVSKVLKINHTPKSNYKVVVLADGSELCLTPDHPILSDKGWAAFDKDATKTRTNYINETVLPYRVDSFIYTIDANFNITVLPVIEIRDSNDEAESYSLELDNSNAAFIANGFFTGQE